MSSSLVERAYEQIGVCDCPPVANLCGRCELLRELISEIVRLRDTPRDATMFAQQLSDAYFAWNLPDEVHKAVAERLIGPEGTT